MPLLRSFRNLPQRTRMGVGLAFLAWGGLGLYISDRAEKTLGLKPSPQDRENLEAALPTITLVERDEKN